jgi:hypothetical protein
MTPWRSRLEADGFAILEGVLSPAEVIAALAAWEDVSRRHAADAAILGDGPPYGARNLLRLWPGVADLARRPPLRNALRDVLGPEAGVVRALYFDKPPGRTWALPWHKDYTVAVAAHRGGTVFTRPTTKAGVPHAVAPVELLGAMLTARVHLDDMTADNGPLRVMPVSHRTYRQADDEAGRAVEIHCRAGDVLLMRPLLTHASGPSRVEAGLHRRIVHLECAPTRELPDGYEWHDFEPVVP